MTAAVQACKSGFTFNTDRDDRAHDTTANKILPIQTQYTIHTT